MDIKTLDFIFPFIVLAYGASITLILNTPFFIELAEKRLPSQTLKSMQSHRILALISLYLGALWSLQNLWFQNPIF